MRHANGRSRVQLRRDTPHTEAHKSVGSEIKWAPAANATYKVSRLQSQGTHKRWQFAGPRDGKKGSNASDMLIMLYLCDMHKTPSPELCLLEYESLHGGKSIDFVECYHRKLFGH